MKLRIYTVQMIDLFDWNRFIEFTYGKPYNLQQQEGCMSRGIVPIVVPNNEDDYEKDSVPEKINGLEMGVSFEAWKARDPKQPVNGATREWEINLFWHRNFYPSLDVVANDLYNKGLLDAGEYLIHIDW